MDVYKLSSIVKCNICILYKTKRKKVIGSRTQYPLDYMFREMDYVERRYILYVHHLWDPFFPLIRNMDYVERRYILYVHHLWGPLFCT